LSEDYFILKLLFSRDDLSEQADFSVIARDIVKEEYHGDKQRYFKACKRLNEKIAKQTNNKVLNFLKYSSGKSGWCNINLDYL